MEIAKYYGPPGCGKTTKLLEIMEREFAAGVRPDRLAYLSFTKQARRVAITRACDKFKLEPEDLQHFRTLHAICYRELNMAMGGMVKGGNDLQEFGNRLGLTFSVKERHGDDAMLELPVGGEVGDRLLQIDHIRRHNLQSVEEAWMGRFDDDINLFMVRRFVAEYDAWKQREGLRDFTDLLEQADEPLEVDVVIVDEAQDLSKLQWASLHRLAANAERMYIAGDDDQCQPPGEFVLTGKPGNRWNSKVEEWVDIADLDPAIHTVIPHIIGAGVVGNRKFTKVAMEYHGSMTTVSAGDFKTRCTPNHQWYVRWTDKTTTAYVTYLMQRGSWFRVGQCKLNRADKYLDGELTGANELQVRARVEQADNVWILTAHQSAKEARFHEAECVVRYGISDLCFQSGDVEYLHSFFERNPGRLVDVNRCLADHGRHIDWPLWKLGAQTRRGVTAAWKTATYNLLPDLMSIPVYDEHSTGRYRSVIWSPLSIVSELYTGLVYSLDVEVEHTYVVNHLATCNSIFTWAGADPRGFIDHPGKVLVLEQSYRVPSSIHPIATGLSDRLLYRQPKNWLPRNAVGQVNHAPDISRLQLDPDAEYLMLYRHHYLVRDVEDLVRTQGLPYTRGDRPAPGAEWGSAIIFWERFRKGQELEYRQMKLVLDAVARSTTISEKDRSMMLDRGKKTMFTKEMVNLPVHKPWYDFLTRLKVEDVQYLRTIISKRGAKALTDKPKIKLTTIHASKGDEADNVILLTEMSNRTRDLFEREPDEERRVFYVGVTRAKESLTLVAGGNNPLFP